MSISPLVPAGLRCAHQADPLGVAPDRVRFSWRLEGTGENRAQRAYQVLVTNDTGVVAWDSGRVESSVTADIPYPGAQLTAGGRYRWKVRAWDEAGRASDWSDPAAAFEVELDRTGGWHASWIAPSRSSEGFDPKRAGAHYGTEPELLAQLVLRLADGSEQRIVTDGSWESVRRSSMPSWARTGRSPRGPRPPTSWPCT